ncbi:MAG: LysM peptidoglycan-binding domain-containing protein [Anaerolineae bacterium]
MKKKFTVITTLLTLLVATFVLALGTGSTVNAQDAGQNLLANPGFEGAFSGFVPIFQYQQEQCKVAGVCNTAQVPSGWTPWWTDQTSSDEDWQNRMPEYKPVCPYAPCPWPERLGGGQQALQYFTFWGSHQAGFYQTVNVPTNAILKFSILGQAWSTSGDSATSKDPTAVNMRIGIDPTGGVNPYSATVVWSGFANPYDAYVPFEVVATAQGDKVTVFTWSNPTEARKHNDIYWDESSLVTTDGSALAAQTTVDPVTGAVSTVAAPVVNTSVRFAPAGPTPTPNSQGFNEVLVESGDTLWSIAARAGLTLDELLELNPNLNRNSFIGWGDRIVVGKSTGSAAGAAPETTEPEPAAEAVEVAEAVEPAPEESAAESEAAPEEVVEVAPTAEPVATATPSTGSICLRAFDDANSDGVYASGESLRAGVAFTLAKDQAVVSNYITDGVNEPFCIEGLDPGNYRISRSILPNEVATNGTDWGASIIAGSPQQFDFGSRIDDSMMAEAEIAEADGTMEEGDSAGPVTDSETDAGALEEASAVDAEAESGGFTSWLVWIILAIALILIVGVALVIMSARRATIE